MISMKEQMDLTMATQIMIKGFNESNDQDVFNKEEEEDSGRMINIWKEKECLVLLQNEFVSIKYFVEEINKIKKQLLNYD